MGSGLEVEVLKRYITIAGATALILLLCFFCSHAMGGQKDFLVLCYHSIPERLHPKDPYAVSRKLFVEQMEYLRTHGYTPVSVEQIVRASKGIELLPERAVLLTFDDAYLSYYEFVFPLLQTLGYPSVLGIVGSWQDKPPPDLPEPLMNWGQIREVSRSPLVEIASHTYDMHKGIRYTSQGNIGPSMWVRQYFPKTRKYESLAQYRLRLRRDFEKQHALLKEKLGISPRVLIWPYGKYNTVSVSLARKQGYQMCLTLEEGFASLDRLLYTNRMMPRDELRPRENPIFKFKRLLKGSPSQRAIRAVQVDLDLIYDPSSFHQTEKNLGLLIDRLVAMKVNTVFLQAFADPDGDGNVESVYFPNKVLPTRADIFGWAVHRMIINNMAVYAWMPMLSFVFPDSSFNEKFRIQELVEGKPRKSRSWYKRLTPFAEEVKHRVEQLYEDLSAHCMIDGILFQDDAYLAEGEDFHPLAIKSFEASLGKRLSPGQILADPEMKKKWEKHKSEALIDFTKRLERTVRKFRPTARFARNIYAPVVLDPANEAYFAQDYKLFVENYDWVVVMAYPQMEGAEDVKKWLRKLVSAASKTPRGLNKTVFKIQTFNWQNRRPIPTNQLLKELRIILAAGGRHLAYYPDNCYQNQPQLDIIKLEMSTKDYPFLP